MTKCVSQRPENLPTTGQKDLSWMFVMQVTQKACNFNSAWRGSGKKMIMILGLIMMMRGMWRNVDKKRKRDRCVILRDIVMSMKWEATEGEIQTRGKNETTIRLLFSLEDKWLQDEKIRGRKKRREEQSKGHECQRMRESQEVDIKKEMKILQRRQKEAERQSLSKYNFLLFLSQTFAFHVFLSLAVKMEWQERKYYERWKTSQRQLEQNEHLKQRGERERRQQRAMTLPKQSCKQVMQMKQREAAVISGFTRQIMTV